MATLDWLILVLFLGCLIGIVFWVLKYKKDNTSDYFLSGRSETWLAVGAAIFAANIWFRAFGRIGRGRRQKWYGHGALGNAGLDDPYSGLGIRAFLCA
jgi:hypothetical protein